MAFDAGVVSATLTGHFNPAGFIAFNSAVHHANGQMTAATASGGAMSRTLGAVGKMGAFAAAGGLLAFGLAVGKSVSLASKFEAELSRLQATTGANAAQMDRMKKSAMAAGAATKFSALDAASAQVELAKGGLAVADIAGGALDAALGLAAAGEMELAEAASTVVNAMKLFKVPAEDAVHVADALATAANTTTADVDHFAMALTQGGSAAKAAGMSLDETVAILEAFADNSVKGSDAGTSLKTMLTQLAAPTDKQKNAAKALNLELWTQNGRLKSLPAMARELDGAFGKLTNQQRLAAAATIAGTDGQRGLLALFGSSPQKMQGYLDGLSKTGTAAEVAAKKQDNLQGKIEALKGSLETAGIALGEGLLPGLTEGAEKFTDTINSMDQADLKAFGEDLGEVVSAFVEAGPAMADGIKIGMMAMAPAVKIGEVALFGLLTPISAIVEALVMLGEAANLLPGVDIDLEGIKGKRDDLRGYMESISKDLIGLDGDKEVKVKVTAEASQATAVLNGLKGLVLKEKVVKVLASTESADAKIKALVKLGIPPKDARVLAQVAPAMQGVKSVKEALALLKDRTVKVDAKAEAAAAALRGIESTKLKEKVLKILGKDISAAAKVKQIQALGIDAKTAKILGENAQALNAVNAVRNSLSALPDSKTVTLTTITKNVTVGAIKGAIGKKATGRGAEGAERALVAEGRGPELVGNAADGWQWVTQPTIMDLGTGDSVIPSDPAYAGRALGLMFAAMGIPGYAKGKAPTKPKKALAIPEAVSVGAVPESDLAKERDDARESYQKRKERVRDLGIDVREQRKKVRAASPGKARKSAQAKLDDLEDDRRRYEKGGGGLQSLAKLKDQWRFLERQYAALRKTNREIERLNKLQENDRTKMATASKKGDEGGWEKARAHRNATLKTLREMYAKAAGLAKPGSNFAAELEGQLATIEGEIADAAGEAFGSDGESAADRLKSTGMTDAERKTLEGLQAQQSLAALTATLDDDKASAQGIEGFLTGILAQVQADPARGGATAVRDIADQLRAARDNVASFSGGGANANSDLQAQLDQAQAATATALRAGEINRLGLATFQGAGDIGQAQIIVNTLHPGDSRTLAAIAEASNAGNGQQAAKTSPRTFLGL